MSTLIMMEGEARIIKLNIVFAAGVPTVTAAFADIPYNDLDVPGSQADFADLRQYSITGKIYRQGTPSTVLVTKTNSDFMQCTEKGYTRAENIVLLPLTLSTQGVHVLELTLTKSGNDVFKDASTTLVVRRGAA